MGWFGFGGGRDRPIGPTTTADAVQSAVFTQTKFREGYDVDEVDAFLERCVATLRALEAGSTPADGLTADEVVKTRFSQTKFRLGYDSDEVDDLLDKVTSTLRAAESDS